MSDSNDYTEFLERELARLQKIDKLFHEKIENLLKHDTINATLKSAEVTREKLLNELIEINSETSSPFYQYMSNLVRRSF